MKALVQQCLQPLPPLLVQVFKPAPRALLVLPSLNQGMAVEVACACAGEDVAGRKQLRWAKCFL